MEITNYNGTTPAMVNSIDSIHAAFIGSLDKKQATREQYSRVLRLFFGWVVQSGLDIRSLCSADLLKYKQSIYAAGKKGTTAANSAEICSAVTFLPTMASASATLPPQQKSSLC